MSSNSAHYYIEKLRNSIRPLAPLVHKSLDSDGGAPSSSNVGHAASAAKAASEAKDNEVLILEALKSGLQFQKTVSTIFLSQIESAGTNKEGLNNTKDQGLMNNKGSSCSSQLMHPTDFWLLLLLHSVPTMRKAVEKVFKAKVCGTCQLIPAVVESALTGHTEALGAYFENLLQLAEMCGRSNSVSALREFGTTLYVRLFCAFTPSYHRQEVLSRMLGHVGSRVPAEVDMAMSSLVALSSTVPASLYSFQVSLPLSLLLLLSVCPELSALNHPHTARAR